MHHDLEKEQKRLDINLQVLKQQQLVLMGSSLRANHERLTISFASKIEEKLDLNVNSNYAFLCGSAISLNNLLKMEVCILSSIALKSYQQQR